MEAGADTNSRSRDGFTPLMGASRNGHSEIVRMLLHAGAESSSALFVAASAGQAAILRLLLEAGADKNSRDDTGYTGLMLASLKGHSKLLECFWMPVPQLT